MDLKRDGFGYSGVVGPCEFYVSRTVTVPATRIPGKDCRAAVDVVASAIEAGAI